MLDRLAHTPNPFIVRKSDKIDLSEIKPELAHTVEEFREGGWAQPGLRFLIGKSRAERTTIKLTTGELVVAALKAQARLSDNVETSRSALTRISQDISSITMRHAEGTAALELAEATVLMEALTGAAQQVPSEPVIRGLGITLEAAFAPSRYATRILRTRHEPFSILGRVGQAVSRLGSEKAYKALEAAKGKRKLECSISLVREEGTSWHKALVGVLRTEEVRDAVLLLHDVVTAKQQLPEPEQLEVEKFDKARAAEQYLVAQADMARTIIQRLDPSRFGKEALQETLKRARTDTFAGAMVTRQALAAETSRREAEGRVPNLSTARDVLQGGRRLPPPKGLSEHDIQQKADALDEMKNSYTDKKALTHAECGIAMAIFTGQYGQFEKTWANVKSMDETIIAAISSRKREPLTQLKDFDLEKALQKISAFLSRTPHQQKVADILGSTSEMKQLHKSVKKILKQRERPNFSSDPHS